MDSNEIIFQLNFPPNPLFLDMRGAWASRLCQAFQVKEWSIDPNSVKVFNTDGTKNVIVAYSRIWLSVMHCKDRYAFTDLVKQLIDLVMTDEAFGQTIKATRIAVRSRFYDGFDGTFADLVARHRQHFADFKPETSSALPSGATAQDLFSYYLLDTSYGELRMTCAPAKHEEIKGRVFNKNVELMPSGWFCDLDYYRNYGEGQAPFSAPEVTEVVARFAEDTWNAHARMRKLIFR